MGLLKRISEARTAVSVPQTYKNEPFSLLKSYVPLSNPQTMLYKQLREAVPVIDAAIYKLIRLTGGFSIQCSSEANTKKINEFMQSVPVGAGRYGISEFISAHFEQLLTYGTAVGEIVTNTKGGFAALFNADIRNIELKRSGNGIDTLVCTGEFGNVKPVKYQNLVLFSVLNPDGDSVCGTSILRGLPFVSGILTKIFTTIGENWERAGNVRYAVTYKPQNDVMERAYAKDRAQQVAKEWSEAMKPGGPVRDFIAVGDVSIKAIGADNQILDCEVPSRLMLEQIVAKTGLPPFMLGFSWASTERMSKQQADLLTSELEAYRRALTPVLLKICNTYLALSGISDKAKIIWDEISLQDEVEQSRARLYRAQSAKIEQELKGEPDE